MAVLVQTCGDASVVVDVEAGGRVASLVVDDDELLVGEDFDPLLWGCYPMVPWAGRVRRGRFEFAGQDVQLPLDLPPHAIHGTAYRRPWTVDGSNACTIELGPDWPWPGRARHVVDLQPDRLELTLEVQAESRPFPVTLGWHPWFRRRIRDVDCELQLAAGSMYRRDADGIPDGTLVPPPPGPWDDCFTDLREPTRLRWPGVLDLVVESPCDHVVVYDGPDHAVCVEPQTGPPDAFTIGGATTVFPGRPVVATMTLRWG